MANVVVLEPARAGAIPSVSEAAFEERWAAWKERGAAHDRAVKARARILLPVAAAAFLGLAYVILSR